ncbi:murein L,D-transpeptidase YafK [Mesorhizobium sp. J18]|uniref:L,D-transpeptidase family protein n=1 Tax=Mesorhizobium sp. J18 TaxID=935263 RepID=UPI00119B3810|nr:murein L,D-transpeptidase family protein [Mesorhizobium sp. J18]TWG98097.1 murein L,D-transpeptidase YafK [Mesorhizobium sp. J18]
MTTGFARAAMLVAAMFVAGCNGTLEDIAPKAERQLPAAILTSMKAKGMKTTSPIMIRIFKEEGVLEVWKQKDTGRYDLIANYDICKWSGKLGPKFTEGDRQAPEGFYTVRPYQMNPNSSYYLAFNIGFPNAYDRANGRTGQHLMVHGDCSSSGCYSMTDEQMAEIYAFARDAFRGGQTEFQIQAFPFRMTAENMARYRNDPNFEFWKMLKEGYDHFEITRIPPKVDVCERRYVFNRQAPPGTEFSPLGACPVTTQPDSLRMAYQSYQSKFDAAFSTALNSSTPKPKPSITGLKEAALVADWSRRRARGERVSREPPSLTAVAEAEPAATAPRQTQTAARTKPQPAQSTVAAAAPRPDAAPRTTGSVTASSTAEATAPAPQPAGNAIAPTIPQPSAAQRAAEAAVASVPAPEAAPAQQAASAKRPLGSRLWSLFGG